MLYKFLRRHQSWGILIPRNVLESDPFIVVQSSLPVCVVQSNSGNQKLKKTHAFVLPWLWLFLWNLVMLTSRADCRCMLILAQDPKLLWPCELISKSRESRCIYTDCFKGWAYICNSASCSLLHNIYSCDAYFGQGGNLWKKCQNVKWLQTVKGSKMS